MKMEKERHLSSRISTTISGYQLCFLVFEKLLMMLKRYCQMLCLVVENGTLNEWNEKLGVKIQDRKDVRGNSQQE